MSQQSRLPCAYDYEGVKIESISVGFGFGFGSFFLCLFTNSHRIQTRVRRFTLLKPRYIVRIVVSTLRHLTLSSSVSFAWKNRMSVGEPHEHGETACAYKGVSRVNVNLFCLLQLRRVLPFVCVPILALFRPSRFSVYPRFSKSTLSSPNYLESFNRRLEQNRLCIVFPLVSLSLSSRGAIQAREARYKLPHIFMKHHGQGVTLHMLIQDGCIVTCHCFQPGLCKGTLTTTRGVLVLDIILPS